MEISNREGRSTKVLASYKSGGHAFKLTMLEYARKIEPCA